MFRSIQRAATGDRGPPGGIEITTAAQLSPNMHRAPNGNLICLDVAIARVGWMIYGPGETPIEVGKHTGLAYVMRDEAALFDPKCIGSFMGAAVVDEHPEEDVTPDNWKELSRGFATTNVRRGEGDAQDVLLADLIITEADLIEAVLEGKREVSCGYYADYEQTGDGEGKQTNIIGNHIALVEKGRCGPRCAIGDRIYQPDEGVSMTTRVKIQKSLQHRATQRRAVLDARRKVLDAEQELAEAEEGVVSTGSGDVPEGEDDNHTHIHIHAGGQTGGASSTDEEEDGAGGESAGGSDYEARLGALETTVKGIADSITGLTEAVRKMASAEAAETDETITGDDEGGEGMGGEESGDYGDGTQDEEPEGKAEEKTAKTMDSKALQGSWSALMAQAEILVPGFKTPTFDAKAKRKATVDAMCSTRRKVLGLACSTTDGSKLVTSVNGGAEPDLDKMGCADVASLFKAAAGAKALLNQSAATRDASSVTKPNMQHRIGTRSLAEINKANAEFWANHK